MSVHSYLYGKSTDYIPVPFGWPVLLDSTFLDTPGLVADADAVAGRSRAETAGRGSWRVVLAARWAAVVAGERWAEGSAEGVLAPAV